MDGDFQMARDVNEKVSAYLVDAVPRSPDRASTQTPDVTPIEYGSCTYHEAAVADARAATTYLHS